MAKHYISFLPYTPLQLYWYLCYSSKMVRFLPPQGLYTCYFIFLESFPCKLCNLLSYLLSHCSNATFSSRLSLATTDKMILYLVLTTLFFLIFIFTLFYFTILYWFCHTLTWIHHGCTCVPKHEHPSHLPPHNVSLGHHRAPAPSMLYPALDIDWRFNSYMIVYMLQCHSPKSSHPLPLPLSPKVRYTHLCLFCCLAYRVVIAIFLNSIYMC